MIRFALIVASTLGFVLTAALGNLMTPLLRAFRVQQEENEPPTMGGLCLMVGTLAAVGVGWTAACVAQPELLGTESLLTTRLLIALFGALCFGAVGLADDVVRLRHRSPLGLRRPVRLALEAASGTLVLALLRTRREGKQGGAQVDIKKIFPWFVLLFLLASIITTVLPRWSGWRF